MMPTHSALPQVATRVTRFGAKDVLTPFGFVLGAMGESACARFGAMLATEAINIDSGVEALGGYARAFKRYMPK